MYGLTPSLIETNCYDKIQVGTISSWFSLTYSISKFIGGILSDVLPSDSLFICSLLFASISLVGLASSNRLSSLCILRSIHGLCQGVGRPALTRYVVITIIILRQLYRHILYGLFE